MSCLKLEIRNKIRKIIIYLYRQIYLTKILKMKLLRPLLFATLVIVASSFIVEKSFPQVELKDLKGNKVKTESFITNKKITVVSFFATWCKPCQLEMDNISEIYEDWVADYDVEMIAISVDNARSTAKLNALVKSKDWPFEILVDDRQQIQNILGFQTIPQTFLLDENGNIVYEHNGYKSGDEVELEDHIAELAGK